MNTMNWRTVLGTLCAIAVLVSAFFATRYFIEQHALLKTQEAALLAAEEAAKARDALFAPEVSTVGIDCTVGPDLLSRSNQSNYLTLQASDPAKIAAAILAAAERYPGATVQAGGFDYDTSAPYSADTNASLEIYIPAASATAFAAEFDAVTKEPGAYIQYKSSSSVSAQHVGRECENQLARLKVLELKEAVYLEQLRKGGDKTMLEEITQSLADLRLEAVSMQGPASMGILNIDRRLNSAYWSIQISLLKG